MNYQIPLRSLAITIHAAGKRDVRYYLNSVLIEGQRCIATDGSMLLYAEDNTQEAPEPLLLPRDAVEWSLKAAGKKDTHLSIERDGEELQLTMGVSSYRCRPIDGKFPDWQQVVPHGELSRQTVAFDGRLLARLAKAATAGGDRYCNVRIEMAGDRSARVDFPNLPGVHGVIMPMSNTVK